ncbi:hypothetical protein BZG36_02584 [Bifiguratus adelaidae]|uniref:Wax synthase domain-containing protein n=1 Tax=Bifiguratus adelaidae TaxID=1938954 RepID=A0A261Y119_9FUNG|nr:hypothetical protein BZG36_02584 [Bifiguratus adelaidae]
MKWQVSFAAFSGLFFGLEAALWLLLTLRTEKVSSRTKRVIAVPLLLGVLFVPAIFSCPLRGFELTYSAFGIGSILRLVDLYWIIPRREGRQVYLSPDQLSVEAWAPLRRTKGRDGTAKSTAAEQEAEGRISASDKKSIWRLAVSVLVWYFATDVLGSWLMTFGAQEVVDLVAKYPAYFALWSLIAMAGVACVFNLYGRVSQLCYILFSLRTLHYDPDEWPLVMPHPYLATSISDFWSKRWHQIFRRTWVSFAYKPVLRSTQAFAKLYAHHIPSARHLIASMSSALASLSVFAVSGFMHEYIALVSFQREYYKPGRQMLFFVSHGLAVVFEAIVSQSFTLSFPGRKLLGWIWVMAFGYWTFPWFFQPYMRDQIWHILSHHPTVCKNFVHNLCKEGWIWCGKDM